MQVSVSSRSSGTSAGHALERRRKWRLSVRVADESNDILDSADVYTDLTGGIVSDDASTAWLIASAFADWKQSENGLVTIYNADGEVLDNGKF
jgi:hypothetical protein